MGNTMITGMMRTGIAYREITPRESVPLLGYGDRTHDSEGIHDPLYAYAWWMESGGLQPWVWIVLDLCLISVVSSGELALEISRRIDVPAGRIFVSTTHTHSAPDVHHIGRSSEPWAKRYYSLLIDACSAAVQSAREQASPAKIQVRSAESDLGANRRDVSRPVDRRVLILSLIDESGRERGLLFHYSCHLTVLGVDNYRISSDWLGPVRSRLQSDLGVPVMFIQGAEGNVDPVSRGVLDMADPDQAVGSSFEVMEKLSEEMIETLRQGLHSKVGATLTDVSCTDIGLSLPLRYGALSPEEVREKIGEWKQRFASFLGVSPKEVPESWTINALVKRQAERKALGDEEIRAWVAEQFAYCSFLNTYKDGGELIDPLNGEVRCSVTILDFGAVTILGAPMEVLLNVAFDWQNRFPDRIALIAGLFNGWLGYLPHKSDYDEPLADRLYETVSTVFAPEASRQLLEAAERSARGSSGD
jgi:hypothetical protein